MRLLIDANILLDVLQKRDPYVEASSFIWKLCEAKRAAGFVSTLTFSNIIYVMRRELPPEKTEDVLHSLKFIFEFADLSASDLSHAARLRWDNFEDALQSVIANRIQADYIITRNKSDYGKSKVKAVTPSEFIGKIANNL